MDLELGINHKKKGGDDRPRVMQISPRNIVLKSAFE